MNRIPKDAVPLLIYLFKSLLAGLGLPLLAGIQVVFITMFANNIIGAENSYEIQSTLMAMTLGQFFLIPLCLPIGFILAAKMPRPLAIFLGFIPPAIVLKSIQLEGAAFWWSLAYCFLQIFLWGISLSYRSRAHRFAPLYLTPLLPLLSFLALPLFNK